MFPAPHGPLFILLITHKASQSLADNHSQQSSFYSLYRVVCTTSSLLITHKASQSLTDNHSHQSSFYCLYRVVCTTASLLITHKALLGVYTVRSSDRPVGPTQATSDCLSDQSDRPVGQTVAEPPT